MKRLSSCTMLFFLFCFPLLCSAHEIHEATQRGDLVTMRRLLDQEPGLLYMQDKQGKTPLHWAVGKGQLEAMKVLLDEYKVRVDVRNVNEGTPLHVAASQAQPEAAKILIAHGATLDARTKEGFTPLHFAAFKGKKEGHIETARLLLENKANPDARAKNGSTPLGLAETFGNREITGLLLRAGAKDKGTANTRGTQGKQRMMRGFQQQMNWQQPESN